ncbi:MAG TPA: calcium-binding protein [Gaiellaceae bacterium]|jgi:Ca2+-binding RTX toxin-like protein
MKIWTITRRPKVALALTAGLGLAIAGATLATVTPASGAGPAGAAAPNVVAAGPGSDATVVSKSFDVGPGKVGDATVACPAGTRATGGGVLGGIAAGQGYMQQSGPVDETGTFASTKSGDIARGWSASVFNPGANGTTEFQLAAICSASSDATIAANPFTVEPRTVDGASVDCPAGQRALGGGLGQPDPTSPLFGWIRSSGPVDATGTTANTDTGDVAEGWYASVFNFGASARDFHVFAICSAGSDATIEASGTLSVEPGSKEESRLNCPAGRRVVGGGVGQLAATNTPGGYILDSTPVLPVPPSTVGRTWLIAVYNPPEVGAPVRKFRAFAICAGDATATPTTTTAPKPTTTAPLPTTTAPPPKPNVYCGALRATIVGTPGRDVLTGTPGRDVVAGLGGNDLINGLGGNDVICGGDGNDKLIGAAGNDVVYGGAGSDYVTAGTGNDRVGGDAGNDRIFGGAGNDSLYGGIGNDLVHGDAGNDAIDGGDGNDTLVGGPGVDTLAGGPG